MGHIRDVRRLIVAMSRAKLGLYIFCRKELFENCYELRPVFEKLLSRPVKLSLRPNETYMTTRSVSIKLKGKMVRHLTHIFRERKLTNKNKIMVNNR